VCITKLQSKRKPNLRQTRIEKQTQFILEIDKLKKIVRRSYLLDKSRKENTAEHSWHVSTMAIMMSEHFELKVDVSRVLKMLLIHDIVEIDAGDTYIYDEIEKLKKSTKEKKAAKRIFGLLPKDQNIEMTHLWQEYEEKKTPEAQYAYCMDRVIPLLHNYHTQGRSWQEHGIIASQVYKLFYPIKNISPFFYGYAMNIIEKSIVAKYILEQ
jgi:putative hydrolases of HD superfamily